MYHMMPNWRLVQLPKQLCSQEHCNELQQNLCQCDGVSASLWDPTWFKHNTSMSVMWYHCCYHAPPYKVLCENHWEAHHAQCTKKNTYQNISQRSYKNYPHNLGSRNWTLITYNTNRADRHSGQDGYSCYTILFNNKVTNGQRAEQPHRNYWSKAKKSRSPELFFNFPRSNLINLWQDVLKPAQNIMTPR